MAQVEMDEINAASGRRWMYGLNVALLVIVSVVVLGFFFGLTSKYSKHWDMTSAGLYSLSGSTKNLLKRVDETGKTYTLISMFPASANPDQSEKRQRVVDELEEYARQSKNVKAEEGWSEPREAIEKRIRDLYVGELKPYEDTIGEFDKVSQDLEKFLKDQAVSIGAAAQKPGTPQAAVRQAAQLQGDFGTRIPAMIADRRRMVRRATEAALPEWSTLTEGIKSTVDELQTQLEVLSDPAKVKELVEPAIAAYFKSAAPRYKAMSDELKAYKDKLGKLPALKVETVLNGLQGNTVLILGPTSAKVVAESEMFKPAPPQPGSQEPESAFIGEQALSSALLGLLQPEKIKVVFVSASPQQLTTQSYSLAADMLRENNFDVMEWSPPGRPTGPNQPPQEPNPPAEGKGVVWIVFPPAAPNPQMMMMGMMPPDPGPLVEATKRHMAAGGQVMFLAEAGAPGPMGGGGYPFESLLKDFGIEVQSKYTVVQQREGVDPDSGQALRVAVPVIDVKRYQQHEITSPMQSLELRVTPVPGRSAYIGMPTVVSVRPVADVEGKVLFTTPESSDYWGESDYQIEKPDATYDKTTDYGSPVPLAAAAIRFKGQKDKEQRVVVVGSSALPSNQMLEERLMRSGNQLAVGVAYPGNGEFFRNSVLWLSGYENMISVSSKASVAMRIRDISPGTLAGIRWGILFAGAPLAALVVGGLVWFWRRR
jgi:hypothetical protein